MRNYIFRGYDVDEYPDGHCVISKVIGKDSKVQCEQPTMAAAREWINNQRRMEIERERAR